MAATSWLYWTAAALALGGLAAHELLGTPLVMPPLKAAGLPPEVAALHHFSWHADSVFMVAMAYLYHHSARRPGHPATAGVATATFAGMGLLGLALAIWTDPPLWGSPAPYLFNLIAVIGGLGVWRDRRA